VTTYLVKPGFPRERLRVLKARGGEVTLGPPADADVGGNVPFLVLLRTYCVPGVRTGRQLFSRRERV
jgi:hypothetical protein